LRLDKATGDLERLTRALGGRHYPAAAAVTAGVQAIGRARRVGAYLRTHIGTTTEGKPTLAWHFDPAVLEAEAAVDGWYALLTNLEAVQVDAGQVLRRYTGQDVVERRYGQFKGPLAVAPMFLEDNRRIAALISVLCRALLVLCLVERQVRGALAPVVALPGLWAGRPARPTGRLIFTALARLRLIPASGPDPPGIPRPGPVPACLLALLDVDPTDLGQSLGQGTR
jgi:hypothetical protein